MRLRRTSDIRLVREGGEVRGDQMLTMRARPNGLEIVRVAVAAPRAIGTAVRRNRARRRVREAIRTLLGARGTARGTDVFVIARADALRAAPADLRAAVAAHLDALLGARP